ncbi:hypothetical protein DFJ67_1486 [Asanoa ferruginea]|uniref:DUF4394 domain-containing protein n=1 Tax=Asanoa ferruginea TaxID=53367 RepID=A0A3D9ZE58_9ACTN|nr:hypothetical protein [Asanoa ferruginea]REF95527.1 hypothetical protein DFJ67_1486 [Asanoa ferruginea]GIF46796.1 hypothetical protein Afe04nite_13350 [Asanoa ferruginea]
MRALRTVLAGTAAAALAVAGSVYVLASPASAAAAPVGAVGTYSPVAPKRILDTRSGLGAPKKIVGPGGIVHLQVAGRGGVPATGVSAVVLNLTVTGTLGNGYLTAYPDGVTRPTASSINFAKGATRANSVTVAVGANGFVNIYQNSVGSHIIADVAGYYSGDEAAPVGSTYSPESPFRVDDTRWDGLPPVAGGDWIRYAITYGVPELDSAVTAIAMNITAVNPANGGYITTWNGVGSPPAGVSAVNFGKGGITPNSATVPTSICDFCSGGTGVEPMFGVYTNTTTHWLVDVFGVYFNDSVEGLKFRPITPQRILDTRPGSPMTSGVRAVDVSSAVTPETYALSLNVTAVAPSTNTYLTVYPDDGDPRPTVSTLNPSKGQTVANGTIAGVGDTNQFLIYNNAGTLDVVADMGGLFEYFPSAEPTARAVVGKSAINLQGRVAAKTRN